MKREFLMVLASAAVACLVSQAPVQAADVNPVYIAKLMPMNTKVTGLETSGTAKFTVKGDMLSISIEVKGAPPSIAHWQHFHGFKDNKAATCPTESVDVNHDGIIDLIETGATAGETMVPFITDPVSMDIAHGTYPEASADGSYHYEKDGISVKALTAAFAKAFGDKHLDLDRRVVFIHGVVPSSKLPSTVASLGPIPADVTLPIACGKIERTSK